MNRLRILLSLACLTVACGCDAITSHVTNDALSVEIQPGPALFGLFERVQPGQALVVSPVVGAEGSGRVLASVIAACLRGDTIQVETARTETSSYDEVGGSPYSVVEVRSWVDVAPDTDFRALRGRADGLFRFYQDDPPEVFARISTVPDSGCDEASVLKGGGEYGLVGGERLAVSPPVELHLVPGLWEGQVGTDGFAEPNVIDLADDITVVTMDGTGDDGVSDAGS